MSFGPQRLRTVGEPSRGETRRSFVSPGGAEGRWDPQAHPLGRLLALGRGFEGLKLGVLRRGSRRARQLWFADSGGQTCFV